MWRGKENAHIVTQMECSGGILYAFYRLQKADSMMQTLSWECSRRGWTSSRKSKKLKQQCKIPEYAEILFEISKRKKILHGAFASFDLILLKQTDIIIILDLYTHIYDSHLPKVLSLLCPLKLQPFKIRAVLFFTTGSLSPASGLLPSHTPFCSVSGSSELSGSCCCTLWFKVVCVFLSLPLSLWFTYRGIHYWSHFGCCS